jgi:undecaprenyl-diphosphatase
MFSYIILGIVQGLTEFFPVSSSGHLVIAQELLGLRPEGIVLPIILHLGTLVAVIIFFSKDIISLFRSLKTILSLFTATVITASIALLGKDFFEKFFSSPRAVCLALFLTGMGLIFTRYFPLGTRRDVGVKDGIILGIMQAFAIIPGISRSGSTISTLLFRGIQKEDSFKLSFIASIPLIIGALILEFKKIDLAIQQNSINLLLGFIASLISGLLALFLLRLVIRRAKLYYFGYYSIFIALLAFIKIG